MTGFWTVFGISVSVPHVELGNGPLWLALATPPPLYHPLSLFWFSKFVDWKTKTKNKDFLKAAFEVCTHCRRKDHGICTKASKLHDPVQLYIPSTSSPHTATSSSISRTGMDWESWNGPAWPFVMTIPSQYFFISYCQYFYRILCSSRIVADVHVEILTPGVITCLGLILSESVLLSGLL